TYTAPMASLRNDPTLLTITLDESLDGDARLAHPPPSPSFALPASIPFAAAGAQNANAATASTKGAKMALPLDLIAQTDARVDSREPERAQTQHQLLEVKEGQKSVLTVDDPQREAQRKQRILAQPAVSEALKDIKSSTPLETMGVVETGLLERI